MSLPCVVVLNISFVYEKIRFHFEHSDLSFILDLILPRLSKDDGDNDNGSGGRISAEHLNPILYAPRGNSSQKDNPSLRSKAPQYAIGVREYVRHYDPSSRPQTVLSSKLGES